MNILDFFFPRRCLGCGRIGRYFCDACSKSIHTIKQNEAICPMCGGLAIDGVTHPRCQTKYGLDGLISFFRYNGIIRQAIKMLKYRCVSHITSEFVSLVPKLSFASFFVPHSRYVLIPVPLHRYRYRERGYNQAEIIGRLLAIRLNIPMAIDILKRTKKTVPQVEMKRREARLKNMEGVFSVHRLPPKCVVLFDDVFTTGATMRSAAKTLKRAGAKYIWAVTIAR